MCGHLTLPIALVPFSELLELRLEELHASLGDKLLPVEGHQENPDDDRQQDDRDADVAGHLVEACEQDEQRLEERREDERQEGDRIRAGLRWGQGKNRRRRGRGSPTRTRRGARASRGAGGNDQARRAQEEQRRKRLPEPAKTGASRHAAGSRLSNRVIAAGAPGMAAGNPPGPHPTTLQEAVLLDGLLGVSGAARLVATGRRQPAEQQPVELDKPNPDPLHVLV